MDKKTQKRRVIQQTILQTLSTVWEAQPGLGMLQRQIVRGFAICSVPPSESDVTSALGDLVERGLVACEDSVDPDAPLDKTFVITPAGRDFYGHDCPWNRIDFFSGSGGAR
jgi:DNA-binding PadR family transcriptional regulator